MPYPTIFAYVEFFFYDLSNLKGKRASNKQTANILEYIEIFHRILKSGGLWINLGPLLYHYENSPGEMSIELSLDQVKFAIKEIGFLFRVFVNVKLITHIKYLNI